MRGEDQIQAAIVDFLRLKIPNAIIHHSPNEGNRGGRRGMMDGTRKKRMGMCAGYPDLVIHWRGVTFFIEVKGPKGTLSKAQREFRDAAQEQGLSYFVCRDIDDAQAALDLLVEDAPWT